MLRVFLPSLSGTQVVSDTAVSLIEPALGVPRPPRYSLFVCLVPWFFPTEGCTVWLCSVSSAAQTTGPGLDPSCWGWVVLRQLYSLPCYMGVCEGYLTPHLARKETATQSVPVLWELLN